MAELKIFLAKLACQLQKILYEEITGGENQRKIMQTVTKLQSKRKKLFFQHSPKGFTLLELLITAVIAALVVSAVFGFFIKQNNQYTTQGEISNLQQNVRATLEEVVTNVRYAGSVLPEGLSPILGRDGNPDTIYIRYNETGCAVEVGQNTGNGGGNPIQMSKSMDLSCFSIGERVFIYRRATQDGEWFNVTGVDTSGVTWNEISHSGQNLSVNPQPGDTVLTLKQVKYWIDNSGANATHPLLKRKVNDGADETFAEDIQDLQFVYTLSTGATTSTPAATDIITSIALTITGNTQKKDQDYKSNGGVRTRSQSTVVYLRNSS